MASLAKVIYVQRAFKNKHVGLCDRLLTAITDIGELKG